MPSLTKNIPFESELHKKLCKMLRDRINFAKRGQQTQHERWTKAEDAILAFLPESDLDAQRRAKREEEGEPKYTTIVLPYSYAMLLSEHTYLTSVFFARSPVHQFSGRHGETEDQVQCLEALIAYQVEVGEMLGPYYIWLYDIRKYGVGVMEEYWCKDEIQYASIQDVPDPNDPLGQALIRAQVRVKVPGYEGHRLCNISPFDFLPDPRVTVGQFQTGEFCIVRKRIAWENVVRRKAQGYYINTEHLKAKEPHSASDVNGSERLERPDQTLISFDGDDLPHPAIVTAYECYVTLIPKEWGLGDNDFPEKWVFTIAEDMSVIMGAQPHGFAHGKFPFCVGEGEVEGYGTWKRGQPEIIKSVQNTLDWLINQHFFNVRAAMNNQFLIDPSRVITSDAEDGGPGFIYRLHPRAYGQDVRTMFYQIPVQDMTRGHVTDMQTMMGIGERITGINDQIMGALSQGGRKTATEVRTSTGFGVNRLKTTSEYISATAFSQHAQRLVQGSQQFFTSSKKLRIVGKTFQDMAQDAQQNFLMVQPDSIAGFYDFVPVDGTLPVDRMAMANLWKELLINMRNIPGLLAQYDLARIFSHVASLAGVRNLQQFRIQIGSPQAIAQQVEAGNMVPVGGKRTSNGNKPAGVPAPSPIMPPQGLPQ